MATSYADISQNERWQFDLVDDLVTVTRQRKAGRTWQDIPEAPTYRRQFDQAPQAPQARHFANFRQKFVADSDYRQQWQVKQDVTPAVTGDNQTKAQGDPPPAHSPNRKDERMDTITDSITIKTISPDGFDLMLTLRGPSKELLPRTQAAIDWLKQNDFKPTAAPAPVATPALAAEPDPAPVAEAPTAYNGTTPAFGHGTPPPWPAPAAAEPAPVAGGTFPAETLAVAIDEKGNVVTKVKGGQFGRYGLRVWPEILAAVGIDANRLQAGQSYSLAGLTAHYCLGDNGKPLKVTELTR